MPIIRAQIIGGDAVARAFMRIAEQMPGATTKAVEAAAAFVEGRAKSEGFRTQGVQTGTKVTASGKTIGTYGALGEPIADKLTSRTGTLRASIRSEVIGVGRAAVGPTAVYGGIHEFGGRTPAHTITAKKAKALRFMIGGKVIFRRKVQHPGSNIPARPYLRPAFEKHIAKVRDIMLDSLAKSLSGVTR